MDIRKMIAGLALGATVGLGLMVAPAQAATAASPAAPAGTKSVLDDRSAQATKHFYSSHWTRGECEDRGWYWLGQHPSWEWTCEPGLGTDGKFKYHLYLWY
ncbi:hypothetical protein GCM10010358_83250 [Streptomyces minutiscleroticus]|uniref:Secreted protein n=2 Tax=Streptomyces minutiscleroticus TaxID=68238 RepID=A0A918P5N8_9ACTN|nr:hypothetical protein GCM10010358_83250 [Streptomyces minutiscleroticus]